MVQCGTGNTINEQKTVPYMSKGMEQYKKSS